MLAVAAVWAAFAMGLSLAAVAAVGIVALAVAVIAMRLAGDASISAVGAFEPVPIEDALGNLDELLLDDPLVENAPDSRVVRLFTPPERTPGELVLRIEDYLNDGRRAPESEADAAEQRPADSSAALHAALANIRASLR